MELAAVLPGTTRPATAGSGDETRAVHIEELRAVAQSLILRASASGYLAWHCFATATATPDGRLRYWSVFPIVAAALGGAFLLDRRSPRAAGWFFPLAAAAAVAATIAILGSPGLLVLDPILVLVAVVVRHVLAGWLVGAWSLLLAVALRAGGPPGLVTDERLLETAIAMALTLGAAWVLGRSLLTAVGWALAAHATALENMRSAQEHRAELVQALKQLDIANYRLERANVALDLAWRSADAALRSKAEFVTNISHELRTPLNLIVGFSEMIVTSPESYRERLPAAYRGDINAIYRSAQHLLALTDDVIDLARIGIGRLALAREPLDLARVIGDAADIVREYVEAKGLALRVEVDPAIPPLELDRLRIRQVLLNLLTNAARFTEHGEIAVRATREGEAVEVRVTDTGSGIGPAALAHIFDEFYHGENATDRRGERLGGIGLGLPVSKRFVELHGGRMGVASTPGEGTTFWFTLPIGSPAVVPRGELRRPPRHGGVPADRILVLAEDDLRLAQFLQRHLRGYRVLTAPDVAAASGLAVESRALAILADVDAPAGGADELPVPLVRVPLPHDHRLAALLGAALYLPKPIRRAELYAAIERVGPAARSILIVDDDARFVRLMTRYLQAPDAGRRFDIATALDGAEALELVEARRPDLVLLDLAMPGKGGEEVLAALAARTDLADIPVIVISAQEPRHDQAPSLPESLALVKPDGFRLEEMLGAIEGLLGTLDPPRRYLAADATDRAGDRIFA